MPGKSDWAEAIAAKQRGKGESEADRYQEYYKTIQANIAAIAAENKRLKEQIASYQATPTSEPQYTILPDNAEGKVAVMSQVPSQCPECLDAMEVSFMADRMRIRVRHHKRDTCSRSMTEIIRPIAQFTVFI